jgi:hypothetical protein
MNISTKNKPQKTSKQAIPNYFSLDTKNTDLGSMKSTTYEAKSTTPNPIEATPRRKRTVKAAIKYLTEEVSLRGKSKKEAFERIENAPQPMSEAKRIAKGAKRDKLGMTGRGQVKKAEINKLYQTVLKKVGCLYPSDPHAMLLDRIDDLFHEGDLIRQQFLKMSVELMGMLKGVQKVKIDPSIYNYREPTRQGPSMGQRKDAEFNDMWDRLSKKPAWEGWYGDIPDFLDRRPPHKRAKFKELT